MAQFINRIELCGVVGRSNSEKVGERTVVRFSLNTTSTGNGAFIETCWHDVVYWTTPTDRAALEIGRGDCIHVWGRIRYYSYINREGNEVKAYQCLAERLAVESKATGE